MLFNVDTYYKERQSEFRYFRTGGLLCLEFNIALSFDIYFRVRRNVTILTLYLCSI